MSDPISLSCSCGKTRWQIAADASGTQLACYCMGCQSYIRHLNRSETYLGPEAGTRLYQTLPRNVSFLAGAESLACLRMTSRGALRWYASCCGTPVANTIATPALPFVGLVLPWDETRLGPCRNHVNTKSATGRVRERGMAKVGWGVIGRGLAARLSGATKTPFFANGAPIRTPEILDRAKRQAAGWS